MLNIHALLDARQASGLRHVVLSTDAGDDLDRVLSLCGLLPRRAGLVQLDRRLACDVLADVLGKHLAYGTECMPRAQAVAWAQAFIDSGSDADSRCFANTDGGVPRQWTPLTNATFDAGLLIRLRPGRWSCLWVEDED